MKKFKDLIFIRRFIVSQARLDFKNGYGVSVITGGSAYGDKDHPYELAVMHNGYIYYDTPISDDVIGYLDEEGVTSLMRQAQKLKKVSK